MRSTAISRETAVKILAQQSAEQKLESLERESRNLLELNPDFGWKHFVSSFERKRKNDAERNS
jgi:hypothetical protein